MGKHVGVNAQQWADRWSSGITGASERIKDGVNSVTEAPGQLAADKAELWLQRVTASAQKYKTNVAAVSLSEWKESMVKKGIPAIANSVGIAKPKVVKAANDLIPVINAAMDTLPARGATLDQNLQRVRHMATALQTAFS